MTKEMNSIHVAKKELRRLISHRLSSMPQSSVDNQSRMVADLVASMPEYQRARNISIYLSMPNGELSTSSIVYDAFSKDKEIFVPYLHKSASAEPGKTNSLMNMVSLHTKADYESLRPDAWGIPTPSQDTIAERKHCLNEDESEKTTPTTHATENLDLIIMPGVAFDTKCRRLGHGRGFYDFFLQRYKDRAASAEKKNEMPFLVGLALEEQLLPEGQSVPTNDTDWPVDALIVGDGRVIR